MQGKKLSDSAYYIFSEFFSQILAAIILIAAYVAWVYFSSGYAALITIVIGVALWSFVGKFFYQKKRK